MAEELSGKELQKIIEWALICGVSPGEIASEIM
jgi:hypothetical protein